MYLELSAKVKIPKISLKHIKIVLVLVCLLVLWTVNIIT